MRSAAVRTAVAVTESKGMIGSVEVSAAQLLAGGCPGSDGFRWHGMAYFGVGWPTLACMDGAGWACVTQEPMDLRPILNWIVILASSIVATAILLVVINLVLK